MRKSTAKKRILLPDPKFHEVMVTRFINNLMYDGKKSASSEVFYEAIDIVAKRTNEDGLETFKKALANITPQVEVRSRRVGGATFQIPSEIRPDRKISMGMKWMILYARRRNEKSMAQKLAGEIVAAAKEEGAAFKKKEDVHKMAEANKAFSHFRF
ncbi:MAG: 30S ribosomal protein S7 [Bacteroidia bacterium]|jgi:small subunit ribosomal protein S7